MVNKFYGMESYITNGTRKKFFKGDVVIIETLDAKYTTGVIEYISEKGLFLNSKGRSIHFEYSEINRIEKEKKDKKGRGKRWSLYHTNINNIV